MKKLARNIVKLIKREPVIFITAVAILAQAGNKALESGHFTFTLWMTYAFQMAMAFVARELVVPGDKHEELKKLVSKTIVSLEADFQKRLDERLSFIEQQNGRSDKS